MNIAIVEDDLLQRTALRNWLEDAGHRCDSYNSGHDLIEQAQPSHYQILIFDWMLPGMSGIELLDWLRLQQHSDTPVIFLTSRDSEEDIVLALRKGADDYLVKPARHQELLARLDALARRGSPSSDKICNVGNIHIDTQRQEVAVNGEKVELTQKEYGLSCYLLMHTGTLLSRNELLENVWGQTQDIHTRTVDTHISRIRKKLQLNKENGWHLGAVYQYGYRLDRLTQSKP